jgi:hypothetical protein
MYNYSQNDKNKNEMKTKTFYIAIAAMMISTLNVLADGKKGKKETNLNNNKPVFQVINTVKDAEMEIESWMISKEYDHENSVLIENMTVKNATVNAETCTSVKSAELSNEDFTLENWMVPGTNDYSKADYTQVNDNASAGRILEPFDATNLKGSADEEFTLEAWMF